MTQQLINVGIDVSKRRLDIHCHPCAVAFDVPNTPEGWLALTGRLGKLGALESVCVEATGGLEKAVLAALSRAGLPVRIASPDRVRAYARACGLKAKTDALDAALIARFAASVEARLHRPDPEREKLVELVRLRRQLVEQAQMLKTQSAQITDAQTRRIAGSALAGMARHTARVEAVIEKRIADDDELSRLAALVRSVPGIGPVATWTLIARMPELGTLAPNAIAALLGVAPFDRQSGDGVRRKSIYGGRSDVRKVIYMAALVASRWNPDLAAFKARLKEAGKPAKVVTVAVMNKLIRIINAVVARGTPFVPAQ